MKNQLPKNWIEVHISDIAYTSSGGTPNTSRKEYWEGNIPWINSGKLKDEIIHTPSKFITELGLKESSAKLFPISTVVIALTGATTGKLGFLNFETSTNQSVTGIFPNSFYNSKFLFFQLKNLRSIILSQALGTAQPHINKKIVDETIIKFPPLAEQNRIVNKLDTLFSQLEAVKNKISKLYELRESFFDSIFYKNQGASSLEFNLIERKEKVGSEWKNHIKIGVSAKEGIINLKNLGSKETFENYKVVKTGDFIYNTMRVNIGSIAIYEGIENAITSPDYVVFSTVNISKHLLLNYLKSDSGKMSISSLTTGSVRSRLYFKNLTQIPFPLLSKEQHTKSEEILKWFDVNLRKLNAINTTTIINLEKSILNKAFRGQLTEQLESDGDARELLKEIEALKNITVVKKTSTKKRLSKVSEPNN